MSKFEESNFYKALQDFFINADKKTFLQFLAEFYNRTEGIIDKDNIQDDLIKELRELYLEFNEKGIDENIVREKVNYFLENNGKIKDILAKLDNNIHKINELALDIRLFGTIGTDDDSTTFQNAINSKKLVAIPSGEYKIKQKLKGDTINFVSMDGNEVKLYIEHTGNFFDMELGSGKHHLMENITIVKRNEFLRTGYGFNVLDDDVEVTGNLTLNRVFFYGFDIGINFKYMNWATLKRTMVQNCNIGIFLDGRNKIIQANNGNSFDVELMNNDIGLKISGDAVGNTFENIQVLKNKTGILIDESGMVIHGILNNTFNDLWLEFNTENDCKIYGGRGYLFNNVSHISDSMPLFSNDSYLDNAKIINSNYKIY